MRTKETRNAAEGATAQWRTSTDISLLPVNGYAETKHENRWFQIPRIHALPPMSLILASQSPRRRQLLASAGYRFQVIPPPDIAEGAIPHGEPPAQLVARLALRKAAHIAATIEHGLVIGCDTVAECDGQVLGKPQHQEHARDMLRLLRGRDHRVFSGLCLWKCPENSKQVDVAVTRLIMENVTDPELETYLATDAWQGKAGAFGYQDGIPWIRILEGSESNVVGLPLELLARMLRAHQDPAH
ncbi:MAG: Maf family protein [Planctomycetota bacterium]